MTLAERIIEAKQERANVYEGIKAILGEFEGKEMDALKKEELSKLENKFDNLNGSIVSNEKNLERERVVGEKQNDLNNPDANISLKEKEIHSAFMTHMVSGDMESLRVYNALQQDNPTQAGYLVPPQEFRMELIKEIANSTFMRQKGRVLPALNGAQSLGFPTRTAGMNSFAWGTELAAPTPDTTLAFGKREFKPRPGTSEILISKTLIRNMVGADALIRSEIAEDVANGLETAYMTGDGNNKPLGLFTNSVDGIPAARDVSIGNTATEVKFDGLYEAKYSVKGQYQTNAEWIFHRLVVKQLAKLKDSDGQYIWQPSVVMGTPDMLLGKPVNMSEFAPYTLTTGLYAGIFGDLKRYWICDSLNLEIQVLMELYARTNQVDYITRLETDGTPTLAVAFARVKMG
jgi:HK97 family phage major capsid protein